ncbi:MAG: DJ-1/PfpI family protein [Treponema sp.]|jgi:protease I|nr:DJ-1/PfpI family protein [Treponema sp.]
MDKILQGKAVAVLIDTEYISREVEHYKEFFPALGARVDFLSLLWGKNQKKIICDITNADDPVSQVHTMVVDKDVGNFNPNDYAIVIVAANYVSCRLREIPPMGNFGSIEELPTPPAVKFFADAMKNKKIVKGALCHALWLLTPVPELLKGRKVICHTVVLADIHNAGAVFTPDPSGVVIDDDLVTGRSSAELEDYANALLAVYKKINQ